MVLERVVVLTFRSFAWMVLCYRIVGIKWFQEWVFWPLLLAWLIFGFVVRYSHVYGAQP